MRQRPVIMLTFIILFFILFFPAFAQDSPAYEALTLAQNQTYDIAFSQFKNIGLSTANSYLAFSIPLLIKEKIRDIPEHYFSTEEQAALKKQLIQKKLTSERQKLNTLQKNKDEILFSKVTPEQKIESIAKTDQDIRAVLRSIAYLKNEAEVVVSLPEFLPLSIKKLNNELYERFEYSILQYSKKNNIALLIDGSIEELHDYISLEIRAFDSNLEKNVYFYKNIGEAGKIYDYIEEGITDLVNLVLGRSWASLVINTDFPDSRIYVNKVLKGYGNVELAYLKPETVRIMVLYPGYDTKEEEITLLPYETKVLDINLNALAREKITISTDPEEADLYLNTVWTGKTPLEMESKAGLMEILLIKEGYNDYRFNFTPDTPNPLLINLTKTGIKPEEIQKKKRDEFYLSLGLSLLTLPVAIFCDGYAVDYSNAAENYYISAAERAQFSQTSDLFRYAQWGAFAINVALITDTVFKLFSYLDASDKLANN